MHQNEETVKIFCIQFLKDSPRLIPSSINSKSQKIKAKNQNVRSEPINGNSCTNLLVDDWKWYKVATLFLPELAHVHLTFPLSVFLGYSLPVTRSIVMATNITCFRQMLAYFYTLCLRQRNHNSHLPGACIVARYSWT